jgi:hypothetical protein
MVDRGFLPITARAQLHGIIMRNRRRGTETSVEVSRASLQAVGMSPGTAPQVAGDVNGSLGNTTVVKIQGIPVSTTDPLDGQAVVFNAGAGEYVPATPAGDLTYVHVQGSASTSWAINHSLGKFPSITLVDGSGNEIEADISHTDDDHAVAAFAIAVSGKAYAN